ncbi:MAG TPA: ABC transporter permease [Candidatus Polarisedimenticolia bacterium]|nr:ABC transporter permease [Candidatus Polarisedimenticolia bacterium]
MDNFLGDVRYAIRSLAKTPGFSILAILTLALGIGGCTAIFSVVNGVLLQPLPYDRPDQLVMLRELSAEGTPMNVPEQNFLDWQSGAQGFERMAFYNTFDAAVAGGSEPARAQASEVSEDFFDVLRVKPFIGRAFLPEEHRQGASPAAMVSHSFWQRYLGGDRDLAGKSLRSSGYSFTVAGVLPAGFRFPARTDVWVPKGALSPVNPSRSAHNWRVIARLKPDVALDRARGDLSRIAKNIHADFTDVTAVDATVSPLQDAFTARIRPALLLLLGAVGLLLLIACANVVNMLLARATAQEKEFAVRAALGAGRIRLLKQCVTESLVLALAGAVLGTVLAAWGVDVLLALGQGQIPRSENVRVDVAMLAFALLLSLATSVLLGFAPGWRASRLALASLMNEAGRGGSAGGSQKHLRNALVVSQVALTLVLLVGAGLLARSFVKVMAVDLGFRKENRLGLDLSMPFPKDKQGELRLRAFAAQLEARLVHLPGVVSLGGTNAPPMSPYGGNGRFLIEGRGDSGDYWPSYRIASPGYFKTLGIPLIRGRLFEDADGANTPQVALISRDVAEKVFPNEDPIGKRINTANMDGDDAWITIVGVVADVRGEGPESDSGGAIYTHYLQRGGGGGIAAFTWVLHATVEPTSLIPAIRQIVRSLDPEAAPKFQTLEESFQLTTASRRFNLTLLGVFAGVALALAGMGIYGVLAYSVAQRTREIGIRMALGAQPGQVLQMVVRQGGRLVGVGVAIGLLGGYAVSRSLTTMLFNTSPADPATYLAVCAFLCLVALMACAGPARRAAKVDPMVALRHE